MKARSAALLPGSRRAIVRWTYPLQKSSSAGPMRPISSMAKVCGGRPVFMAYTASTSGRAKSNISADSLSPTQNMPQRAKAMTMPPSTCRKGFSTFASSCLSGVNAIARVVSVIAAMLITIQKLGQPPVQGLNM